MGDQLGVPSRRRFIGTAGSLAGILVAGSARPAAAVTDRYALTGVTVIDGTDAAPARDMTVLISDGRISSVVRRGAGWLPAGTRVIDLAGKYVVPGLIEAHVHSAGPEEVLAPLYPLTGVTTVREMRGEQFHHEWRDKIRAGRLLGPRWIIGSPIMDGVPSLHSHDTGSLDEVATAEQGRAAVRAARRAGADFIKVYSRLSPEAYLAIAGEARREGLPLAGHCPDRMTIARASGLCQVSIEHLHALLLSTSSREAEIRSGLARITISAAEDSFHRYASWFRQIHPLEYDAVRSYQPQRAAALFRWLAARRTAVVPTLAVHRTLELPDETHARPEETKYLPGWMTEWWPAVTQIILDGRTPEQARQIRQIYAHRLRLVQTMAELGVPVLAGTDTGNPYLVPGYALHQELELLVEAGLSPLRALQSATIETARLLGLADSIGTVTPGKAADLVVLDENPLRDIRNTRKIHAVVVDGRLIAHPEREQLLAGVERAAAASQPPSGARAALGCGCH